MQSVHPFTGMSADEAYAHGQQGQVSKYQQGISVLKQYLRDFMGYMTITVSTMKATPVVIELELDGSSAS